MVRALFCSLAGAGVGFLVGAILVGMVPGAESASQTCIVIVFVGGFLAGTGAVAGALIGGVADLLEYLRTRDAVARDAQAQYVLDSSR